MRAPDYAGGGLVNLAAEVEHRLGGRPPSPRLDPELAGRIADAACYVLVLVDGLGDHQLAHPAAAPLAAARAGALDAPFSTQTSVATATLATGLPPSQHGQIAHLLYLPEWGEVVDTLFWSDTGGRTVEVDAAGHLPAPNLAERLAAAAVETVAVIPAGFAEAPLARMLSRGARLRSTGADLVEAVAEEARPPGRLVVVYLPYVDGAAHALGQGSEGYAKALGEAAAAWTALSRALPDHVALIGSADHGHIDVDRRVRLESSDGLRLYGDNRVVYIQGDPAAIMAEDLPATLVPISAARDWWGPPPYHPEMEARLPDFLLVADAGTALHTDDLAMVGYHGGLTEEELRVPLLVG